MVEYPEQHTFLPPILICIETLNESHVSGDMHAFHQGIQALVRTYREHITIIETKVSKSMAVLCKTMHVLDCQTFHILYQSHVEPHMSYCCEIWGSTYQFRLQKYFCYRKKLYGLFITLITMIIYLYFSTVQKYLNFMI